MRVDLIVIHSVQFVRAFKSIAQRDERKRALSNVEVRKLKGEEYDWYECRECGKRWRQDAKKIGHTALACKRYHKAVYGFSW